MVAGRTGGAGNRAKSAHSLRLASCLPDTRVMGVFRRSIRRDAATDSRNDNLAPPRNLRMCGSRGGFGKTAIGRASCRERVCQEVSISVVAVSIKKKLTRQHYTQLNKKTK